MSGWRDRRKADITLYKASRAIARDRSYPRDVRRNARLIGLAFGLRIAFFFHSEPKSGGWLMRTFGKFRYGLYCGIGYGNSEGETRTPVDRLDAACQEHDLAYADAAGKLSD